MRQSPEDENVTRENAPHVESGKRADLSQTVFTKTRDYEEALLVT
jgi:hypothetical protein